MKKVFAVLIVLPLLALLLCGGAFIHHKQALLDTVVLLERETQAAGGKQPVADWKLRDLFRADQELLEQIAQLEQQRRAMSSGGAKVPSTTPAEDAARRKAVEAKTSELRDLRFQRPVKYNVIERSALRAILVQKTQEQFTAQEMHDYARTMGALGLVPEGTDLMAVMLSLYDEQVAAFYVPEERALYTFKDLSWTGGLDRMLLAHELVHALQDQNFDLTKFPLKAKDNDDLALASAALIEGDATVLMTQVYVQTLDPSQALGDLGAILKQNTAKLAAAPAFLRDMLLFPYQQGAEFVTALVQDGGLAAVNGAFRHPPRSTHEVLHPDIYLHHRHDPVRLEPPPLNAPGWRRIGNNVLGEFGLRTMMQERLGAFRARQATQAWNGDRLHAYERGPTGPTGVIWLTAWETESDASEFEQAYREFLEKRTAPPAVMATLRRDERQVMIIQSTAAEFLQLAEQPGGAR